MMKRFLHIVALLLFLIPVSCDPGWMNPFSGPGPEGTPPVGVPIMLTIPFNATELYDVQVGTKSESSTADETRVYDLYVMIFDNGDLVGENSDSPRKIYGRYFSYEHQERSLTDLNNNIHECWYVDNKAIDDGDEKKTKGAVKISTVTCENATLVVLANVSNAITNMNGGSQIDTLNAVHHLKQLQGMRVGLDQEVIIRKDLFLMTGFFPLDLGDLELLETQHKTANWRWNQEGEGNELKYNLNYQVVLTPVDAKVKFRVAVNPDFISAVNPVYWKVYNTPGSCFLDTDWNNELPPEDIRYFDSQQYYFEGKEQGTATFVVDEGGIPIEKTKDVTFYTFCFYMLENRLPFNKSADSYYKREVRNKIKTGDSDSQKLPDSGAPGYGGSYDPGMGTHYVDNGDWEYAPTNGTYVQFDLVLTLTPEGIEYIGSDDPEGMTIGQALTSDAIFTVHLGDFTSSAGGDFDNYRTERGTSYTYTVLINNSKSIFTEVSSDNEVQAGQEGYLLLTDSEIINADCHYEYHQLTFNYRPDMSQDKFSWYVKTPFGEPSGDGGPVILKEIKEGKTVYSYLADGQTYKVGNEERVAPNLDYRWVKFGVNKVIDGKYTDKRHKYPGDNHYDPDWKPGKTVASSVQCNGDRSIPDLMDISQLIQYLFAETKKETLHRQDAANPSSAFIPDVPYNTNPNEIPVIRVTAFIDEYYYEEHPISHVVDRELWRKFVNAEPREMHILSDARSSRDRKSDVILSSHSIIQQSIQTIYNIHAADLKTLWGTEHKDEMREKTEDGWPYWPGSHDKTEVSTRAGSFDDVGKWNGRLNSAFIWDFYSSQGTGGSDKPGSEWTTFLDYEVVNEVPELREAYHGMAFSCLSRNRDNNGDGYVDRNEVRWYLAAINQLAGMWVGNESLSINARLYRPAQNQWRAHIVSSSGQKVCWAEEGGGATDYSWDYNYDSRFIWHSIEEAAKGQSVRCLRNIGTFEDNGTLKDISEAPYKQEIDPYFTWTAQDDGDYYSFHFDRLNPKSMRQLSEGELPYHDQFNIMNCVYLKFETQRRSESIGEELEAGDSFKSFNTIDNPGKNQYPKTVDINKEVTALGYNPYCPPGYRFPNQSEMLLMSLYLPSTYFTQNKNGDNYSSGYQMPTRTYYNRGVFRDASMDVSHMSDDDKTREFNKVGWCYVTGSKKQSCVNDKTNATNPSSQPVRVQRSRCVRDVEMTGYIDGGILMESTEIYPADWTPVTFSFFSSGAAFVSGSLKLCYTDRGGTYYERDIPLEKTPTGMEYVYDQKVSVPSLAVLGLEESDLDTDLKNMKFKITMRNAATSKTFELPVTLNSHLTRCSLSLPAVSDPEKGTAVRVSIGSRSTRSKLSNVVLHWKAPDGDWQAKQLVDDNTANTYSEDVFLKDIIGADAWATEANRYKEYQFYVTANCDDGTHYVSETISQQLVLLNVTPNVDGAEYDGVYHKWTDEWWQTYENANAWYQSLPSTGTYKDYRQKQIICNTLPAMAISNLSFTNGDFIEALLDVTNCVFIRTIEGNLGSNPAKKQTIGMDNILGIGPSSNIGWQAGTLQCYYPAHTDANGNNPATDKLQLDALYTTGSYSKLQVGELAGTDLVLKLSSDGFSWNGNLVTDWKNEDHAKVVPALLNKSTLYVGAVEGDHMTRATYNYIRAIRMKDPPAGVTPQPRP